MIQKNLLLKHILKQQSFLNKINHHFLQNFLLYQLLFTHLGFNFYLNFTHFFKELKISLLHELDIFLINK